MSIPGHRIGSAPRRAVFLAVFMAVFLVVIRICFPLVSGAGFWGRFLEFFMEEFRVRWRSVLLFFYALMRSITIFIERINRGSSLKSE